MSTKEIASALAEICETLQDIAESLDCLAAQPLSNDDSHEVIRHQQAASDYDWLKSLIDRAEQSGLQISPCEYQKAMARIAQIAGL